MIEVNLLKGNAVTSGFDVKALADEGDQKTAALKILVALLPVVGLYVYEGQVKEGKQNEFSRLQQQTTDVRARMEGLGNALELVERYKLEKKKLKDQIAVIRRLSRERLREVRALDALQSLVPQKAWLTNFEIDGTKVKIEGLALSDAAVTDFVEGLEESLFFDEVILGSTVEEKTSAGPLRKYELSCSLGKQSG